MKMDDIDRLASQQKEPGRKEGKSRENMEVIDHDTVVQNGKKNTDKIATLSFTVPRARE